MLTSLKREQQRSTKIFEEVKQGIRVQTRRVGIDLTMKYGSTDPSAFASAISVKGNDHFYQISSIENNTKATKFKNNSEIREFDKIVSPVQQPNKKKLESSSKKDNKLNRNFISSPFNKTSNKKNYSVSQESHLNFNNNTRDLISIYKTKNMLKSSQKSKVHLNQISTKQQNFLTNRQDNDKSQTISCLTQQLNVDKPVSPGCFTQTAAAPNLRLKATRRNKINLADSCSSRNSSMSVSSADKAASAFCVSIKAGTIASTVARPSPNKLEKAKPDSTAEPTTSINSKAACSTVVRPTSLANKTAFDSGHASKDQKLLCMQLQRRVLITTTLLLICKLSAKIAGQAMTPSIRLHIRCSTAQLLKLDKVTCLQSKLSFRRLLRCAGHTVMDLLLQALTTFSMSRHRQSARLTKYTKTTNKEMSAATKNRSISNLNYGYQNRQRRGRQQRNTFIQNQRSIVEEESNLIQSIKERVKLAQTESHYKLVPHTNKHTRYHKFDYQRKPKELRLVNESASPSSTMYLDPVGLLDVATETRLPENDIKNSQITHTELVSIGQIQESKAEDTDPALSTSEMFELSHNTSINNFAENTEISISIDESGYVTHNSVAKGHTNGLTVPQKIRSRLKADASRTDTVSSVVSSNYEMELFKIGFHHMDILAESSIDLSDRRVD